MFDVQNSSDRMVLAVNDTEINEARALAESLAETGGETLLNLGLASCSAQRVTVPVPTALAELMREVVQGVARGASVTIQSVPRVVTTTTAAKMLGISRPTVMKLVAKGELPAHKVGSHTRLRASDVNSFNESRRQAERKAFDELRGLDEALGIEP